MEAQNKPQITKEWLAQKIKEKPNKVIGRALAAIYKNQTSSEQSSTATKFNNGIGFAKPDARVGSIGARQFNASGTLQEWVIKVWLQPAKDGFPRICKYATQLNYIAEAKRLQLKTKEEPNLNLIML